MTLEADASLQLDAIKGAALGGELKAYPSDFRVTEKGLYPCSSLGPHLYLDIQRQELTTPEVAKILGDAFGIDSKDVGYAGLKDKQALTRQPFSVAFAEALEVELSATQLAALNAAGIECLGMERHQNKLKKGHLLGNEFVIVLRNPKLTENWRERLEDTKTKLKDSGVPNFFGAQRFGIHGDNAQFGLNLLRSKNRFRGKRWLREFQLNAIQSLMFNIWLAHRLELDEQVTPLVGDILKTQRGGLFLNEEADHETNCERFKAGEIVVAGPIFGNKMPKAEGQARAIEDQVLTQFDLALDLAAFRSHRLSGARRAATLALTDFSWKQNGDTLEFSFYLPKGSYATILMAHFIQ